MTRFGRLAMAVMFLGFLCWLIGNHLSFVSDPPAVEVEPQPTDVAGEAIPIVVIDVETDAEPEPPEVDSRPAPRVVLDMDVKPRPAEVDNPPISPTIADVGVVPDQDANDKSRRVALDTASMKLARTERYTARLDAAILKADAQLAWIRQNPNYTVDAKQRHSCSSCGGSGKIKTRLKYGNRVSRCNRCGGDGTYETTYRKLKFRDASGIIKTIAGLRKARIVAEERLDADKLAVDELKGD